MYNITPKCIQTLLNTTCINIKCRLLGTTICLIHIHTAWLALGSRLLPALDSGWQTLHQLRTGYLGWSRTPLQRSPQNRATFDLLLLHCQTHSPLSSSLASRHLPVVIACDYVGRSSESRESWISSSTTFILSAIKVRGICPAFSDQGK